MTKPTLPFETMDLDDFEELLADQPDDERWELINGRVVRMMVGARWEHNRIITNLNVGLVNRFRASNSPSNTLVETFRLQKQEARSSLLPDLIVHCGPLMPGATSIDDPTVVFEVLSEGTQRRDREEKWAVYQTLPSLRHYVLVTRDRPHVETIDREGEVWSGFRSFDGTKDRLTLPALSIELPLAEIYATIFS